ncbi:MAG: 50S ribosomal protein L22 [Armatimonadota bacterium]
MEVRAVGKRLRVPPRKARLVADEVKGKHAIVALAELRYHPSKGARLIRKVLRSAVGNAVENHNLEPDSLIVRSILVDEGWRLKRMRARAQGRGNVIVRRTSHVTVVLEDGEPFQMPRSNAKPKPRPKFESPKPTKKKAKKEDATSGDEAKAEVEVEVAAEAAATEEAPVAEAEAEPAEEVEASEEPKAEEAPEDNKE